jgi:hypothetical protein
VSSVDLVQLKAWSEHLCRLASSDPWQVVGALRLGTAPATAVRGVARIGRPPDGVTCDLGLVRGGVRSVTLTFARPSIPCAAFDDAMGHGLRLRRKGLGPDHQVAYRVVIPGAPYSVDVVVGFAERPRPTTPASFVVLRRHRGVTRAAGDVVDEEGWALPAGGAG